MSITKIMLYNYLLNLLRIFLRDDQTPLSFCKLYNLISESKLDKCD